MIVIIEAFEKHRKAWEYTFQTEISFNDFIRSGCLVGEKQPLNSIEKMFGGGYDVDVVNWDLDVDIFNTQTIKRLDKDFLLQISFFPESIKIFNFGIFETPDYFSNAKKEIIYDATWLENALLK